MNRLSNQGFGGAMRASLRALGGFLLVASLFLTSGLHPAKAQSTKNDPYFSSLKADEVNVRKGPASKYDVLWVYRSLGLPVEVTGAHEHWRRVRDSSGGEGWVHFRLLSRLRMALVSPWEKQKIIVPLRATREIASGVVANLEAGVKLLVKSCNGTTCLVSLEGFKGWIRQERLWGVYPGEVIE